MLTFPFWIATALFVFFALGYGSIREKTISFFEKELSIDGKTAYLLLFFIVGISAFSFFFFWVGLLTQQPKIDELHKAYKEERTERQELENLTTKHNHA